MKITKAKLKQIIKEELSRVLVEDGPPDFREIAGYIKRNPSVLTDYYVIAKGEGETMGSGFPDYLTQEFAKRMLVQVASFVTDQEMSALVARSSLEDLVDMIEDKLK